MHALSDNRSSMHMLYNLWLKLCVLNLQHVAPETFEHFDNSRIKRDENVNTAEMLLEKPCSLHVIVISL